MISQDTLKRARGCELQSSIPSKGKRQRRKEEHSYSAATPVKWSSWYQGPRSRGILEGRWYCIFGAFGGRIVQGWDCGIGHRTLRGTPRRHCFFRAAELRVIRRAIRRAIRSADARLAKRFGVSKAWLKSFQSFRLKISDARSDWKEKMPAFCLPPYTFDCRNTKRSQADALLGLGWTQQRFADAAVAARGDASKGLVGIGDAGTPSQTPMQINAPLPAYTQPNPPPPQLRLFHRETRIRWTWSPLEMTLSRTFAHLHLGQAPRQQKQIRWDSRSKHGKELFEVRSQRSISDYRRWLTMPAMRCCRAACRANQICAAGHSSRAAERKSVIKKFLGRVSN